VDFVSQMLDQISLNVQKHPSENQMCLPLNNGCETGRCLVGDRWSNNGSDSVIVLIVAVVDDHVVKDNTSIHNQSKSVLRGRLIRDD
jgi:hypothetical protein